MLKSIEIERFRGIRHSRIDNLGQVNLFFGKNNCGKSSLLDAVFLVSGLSNPKLPININLLRSYQKFEQSDMALDFYNLDTSMPITIKASNDGERELHISLFESASSKIDLLANDNNLASTDTRNKYGLVLKCLVDGNPVESSIIFSKKDDNGDYEQRIKLDSSYKETLACRYLAPKYDFYASIDGFVDIIKHKDEQFILDALRLVEPKITDVVLSKNEVLADVGLAQRIPINMMGDGVRKILSVLTAIYECRGGVVLIDEISNGFHYSVMKDLWKMIVYASEKNNVQVYATTHDIDSIKGLRDAVLGSDSECNVACFKLQRSSDAELQSYHYAVDGVNYALEQEIEIR